MEFLSGMLVQRLGFIDQLFVVHLKKGMMKKPLPRILSVLPSNMVDTAIEELQPSFDLRDGGSIINALKGFGENRVRSLPDAVAKVIDRHFGFFKHNHHTSMVVGKGDGMMTSSQSNGHVTPVAPQPAVSVPEHQQEPAFLTKSRMVTVDLCPSCGEGSLVFEESCKKCYSCGYSEC